VILIISASAIVGKVIIFFLLARAFGYYNIIPLAAGFGLAQIGEFSFVIATLGLKQNIITQEFYSILLSVTIITMFISPFLTMMVVPLYNLVRQRFNSETVQTINFTRDTMKDHVMISGGGRVGLSSGEALDKLKIPFVIIENDFRRFERVKEKNFPVIYGDSANKSVMDAAGITEAKLIMLTIPSIIISREIVRICREMRSDIPIIARTESMEQMQEMLRLEIHEPVQPEFEASLELIRQALVYYGKPAADTQNFLDSVKYEKYSEIYSHYGNNRHHKQLKNLSLLLQLCWLEILPGAFAEGKSIRYLEIRSKTGASVAGILRGDKFYPNPDPDFTFMNGDIVAMIAEHESCEKAESLLKKREE